ncbi:cell surface protein (Mas1) [Metarhizium rileyi]|uniref:Cell surface protein (Mas1) n=1 Tax=Metarhizium rileyi (strain RCEF 4871) TaxID=1649241 RepID=A0A167HXC4_METRR|nr:cell surface protein (Mas1) [Metarhizium rileyi RCEF 4871]
MRYSLLPVVLAATASAHGVVTRIQGANGVVMPGLSVADGTPRDCSSNGCGSQADTAIIRDRDISSGRASPLGRTQGNGPIDAGAAINIFMGMSNGTNAPTNNGASGAAGQEDDLSQLQQNQQRQQRRDEDKRQLGRLMNILGGGRAGGAGGAAGRGNKNNAGPETMVADTAGEGASNGLPTANENGEVTVVYRQINQDGAGPLTAAIDAKSGGTDASAFQNARVTQNVPGLGFGGLSLATNTDFPVKVQMPQGMTCDGKAGAAENVCIVRLQNGAAAGPFGGSAAFTQSQGARKRAIAYRLKKRMELNNRD